MAAIQNERDLRLQATTPRIVPILRPIESIEGLPAALKRLRIQSTATTFIGTTGSTAPATITLTAEKFLGLSGSVTWVVLSGTGTLAPSGDTCTITGSTVTSSSITIRARVTEDGTNYDAVVTLSKLGSLAGQASVDLVSQVTGKLAMGNVTGYGALALLNQVNLNTQVVGALNGQTQVTNLGTLAYASALYADQIGAGTLAVGVQYAGTIHVNNLVGDTISGKNLSGTDFIYIAGVGNTAPLVMQKIGADEAWMSMRGYFGVGRTDNQSLFEIDRSGNLAHGNITTGVTADFLGSSFTIKNQSINYPTFQTSGTGGVILRHESIRLQNSAGTDLLTTIAARVLINTAYLNLRSGVSLSGGVHGDLAFNGTDLGMNMNGTWYKFTKTLA